MRAVPAAMASVRITDGLRFKPARLVVHAGDTVEWHDIRSNLPDTVTADARLLRKARKLSCLPEAAPFDSGKIAPVAAHRHTFTEPGTYNTSASPMRPFG